jgi:rod shape-determining protein MreD
MSNGRVARHLPILITIVAALMLTIAPLPEWIEPFRPDWVALTLIYWSMTFPKSYSVGGAWITGIVLDVAQGTLLGQHALALTLTIYITVKFHLQFRQFPIVQLAATVFALLALYQFILFWVNGVAGVSSPAVTYWGPVISGAIFWPLISVVYSGVRERARR